MDGLKKRLRHTLFCCFTVDFVPYTGSHVLTQLQLLLFSALAFSVLMRTGIYPPELRLINLDTDWFYRRLGWNLVKVVGTVIIAMQAFLGRTVSDLGRRISDDVASGQVPQGFLVRTWPTGSMALWVMLMLLGYLVLYYAG